MPDSASTVAQLLARLARLEEALAERDALIEQLRASNEALTRRVAQLEAALRKDSRNSSKPPSSDGPRKPSPRSLRRPSDRLPGKQPGDPGVTLRQVDDPDEVVVHQPVSCRGCAGSLADAPVSSVEVRQVFDLPQVWMWITEHRLQHRLQHRRCGCGTTTMAEVPDGVAAPVQYGPRVRAVATYLIGYQHLPYERTRETLSDLLGVSMSVGTLASVLSTTREALAPFLAVVRQQIATAPVAHFDETVRHEALCNRVGVRGLHRRAVAAAW